MRRLGLTGVVAGAVFAAPLFAAPAQQEPVLVCAQRAVTASPRILALYYGWYGTPQTSKCWLHYEDVDLEKKRIGSQVHYPASGPYDSTDPVTLERHVALAQGAGIDTLVCSWWGKEDQTDRSLRALLPLAARHGVTVCPLYERVPRAGSLASVLDEWRYLLVQYGRSPAWLKIDGRPVLFVYENARKQLEPEQWAEGLVTLERETPAGVLAFCDSGELVDVLIFDGLFHLNPAPLYKNTLPAAVPAVFQDAHRSLMGRTRRFRRIPVLTVTPGYNDSRTLPGSGPITASQRGLEVDRQDGALYRAQWTEALKQPAPWVLINSFNQWHAGTEIEPSVELGDQYLKLTREYALQLKRGGAAPAPQ